MEREGEREERNIRYERQRGSIYREKEMEREGEREERDIRNRQRGGRNPDLLTAQIAQFAFMGARVAAIEVDGDGILEKGVPDGLQTLQAEEVVSVGHGEGLQQQAGARAHEGLQVPVLIQTHQAWPLLLLLLLVLLLPLLVCLLLLLGLFLLLLLGLLLTLLRQLSCAYITRTAGTHPALHIHSSLKPSHIMTPTVMLRISAMSMCVTVVCGGLQGTGQLSMVATLSCLVPALTGVLPP